MDDSDKNIKELRQLFSEAESRIMFLELTFGRGFSERTYREFREATSHLLYAYETANGTKKDNEIQEAKAYIMRALYVASLDELICMLTAIQEYKNEYGDTHTGQAISKDLLLEITKAKDIFNSSNPERLFQLDSRFSEILPNIRKIYKLVEEARQGWQKLDKNLHASWKAQTIGLAIAVIGLVISVVAVIAPENNLFVRNRQLDAQVVDRIQELTDIQKSLNSLQRYIGDQKNNLSNLDGSIRELQTEKAQLEKLVSVEKDAIQAILDLYERDKKKSRWPEYMASFCIGIFSSLTVTLGVGIWRKKKKMTKQN